jgi:hypothetical protein
MRSASVLICARRVYPSLARLTRQVPVTALFRQHALALALAETTNLVETPL